MRIVSFNIRKAVGLDWRRDPERILEVLREIDADVAVLQEADKRLGRREGVLPREKLARDLGYRILDIAERPDSHGWHGNAILIRDNSPLHSRKIDLPTLEPRGAVSAYLDEPGLEIVGLQLGLTPGMRRKQLAHLSETYSEIDHPVIFAGDFNVWKEDISPDLPGFEIVTPGRSFHAALRLAPLDRFALRGVRASSSHIHESALARRASDHLPIVLDLEES